MLHREGVKVRSNELVRSEWSPQDFQALLGARPGGCLLHSRHGFWRR